MFNQHKKEIVELLNTEAGRFLLGIKDKGLVVNATPNSYHQEVDKGLFKSRFFLIPKIAEIFLTEIQKVEIAQKEYKISPYKGFLHFSGLEKNKSYPEIYLATTNFASESTHRTVRKSNAVWATARAASAGDGYDPGAYIGANYGYGAYYICRNFFVYDTSSLNDSAVILGGNFNMNIAAGDIVAAQSMCLVTHTSASPTAIVDDDFDQVGSTEGASRYAMTAGADIFAFALNATGYGWISKTGYTKLAMRSSKDIDNSAPGGDGLSGKYYNSGSVSLDVLWTTLKTFNGLARASVKTFNGLAIGSVKTINGLS